MVMDKSRGRGFPPCPFPQSICFTNSPGLSLPVFLHPSTRQTDKTSYRHLNFFLAHTLRTTTQSRTKPVYYYHYYHYCYYHLPTYYLFVCLLFVQFLCCFPFFFLLQIFCCFLIRDEIYMIPALFCPPRDICDPRDGRMNGLE